jgi:hypothetical protein
MLMADPLTTPTANNPYFMHPNENLALVLVTPLLSDGN